MYFLEKKEDFGKFLFAFGVFFLIYTSFVAFTKLGVWEDEMFTIQLIKHPLSQMFYYMAHDVHPPLYYLVFKFISKIAFTLNITHDLKLIGRFVSLLPIYLIFIIATTKIKKNFGWLVTGIFSLSVISMPQLMNYAVELRMYSLALFLITICFVVSYEIINNINNKKNWILLTVFSIAATYTHYYCVLGVFLIYLFIFIKLFRINKNELKIWLISAFLCVVSFLPWLNVFLYQTSVTFDRYWIPEISFQSVINCIFYIFSPENLIIYGNESPIISIFGVLLFISILTVILLYLKNEKDSIGNFAICGILIFILVPVIGLSISIIKTPVFIARYMIPFLGIFWLSISILLSKHYDKKIIFVSIISIFLICSLMCGFNFYNNQIDKIDHENSMYNSTNRLIGENDILIIEGPVSTGNAFFCFVYDYLLNDTQIIPMNPFNTEDVEVVIQNINYTVQSNPDKKIFIITFHPDDINATIGMNDTFKSVIFQLS
ncbi:MAG: glycosyltransferase family 39 protein [Methanobrevibacter sp.]|uniref:Glycosyltransferase RgtA/B/C/D-like domain-containing protein n=1 Tax=Methanobrevibacter millerae TaxID=230361 RepID=A0A8T3VCM2_9EURY|nr:hypothetical protein [Methanobrevibacter millerae]MBE6504135.1 hypothetical protein [Methanobrevibacter millerae]MBR0370281.1 glycosyltransferase family 39 protein [Methanobrevibacter sp.]